MEGTNSLHAGRKSTTDAREWNSEHETRSLTHICSSGTYFGQTVYSLLHDLEIMIIFWLCIDSVRDTKDG